MCRTALFFFFGGGGTQHRYMFLVLLFFALVILMGLCEPLIFRLLQSYDSFKMDFQLEHKPGGNDNWEHVDGLSN
jgi:hypothetical protein